MDLHHHQLSEHIIKPMLQFMALDVPGLATLLFATALQGAGLSEANQQQWGSNNGLGLYRITECKHLALWDSYLISDAELASRVRGLASQQAFLRAPHQELIGNLSYSSAMALMVYRAAGACLTSPALIERRPEHLAQLWSAHFDNGTGQARSAASFMENWQQYTFLLETPLAA